jgi:hypothetical protein
MRRLAALSFVLTSLAFSLHVNPVTAQDEDLIKDSFKDNSNGWVLATAKFNDKMSVKQGALTFDIKRESAASWATPDITVPNDIDISVDTVTTTGASLGKWNAAIVIRANTRNTESAFYQFEIDGAGNWAFVRRTAKGEEYKTAETGKLTDWDYSSSHNLSVSARGNSFTFSVDSAKVGTFEDDTINNDDTPKYIALLAGTFKGQDAVVVKFTNLVVTAAQADTSTDTATTDGQDFSDNGNSNNAPGVLLKEDFSNNDNKWSIGKSDSNTGGSTLADGALTIDVNHTDTKGLIRWTTAAVDLPADVDVTVTASVDSAKTKGLWSYGIGVRYYSEGTTKNNGYFYLYEIISDGTWAVTRFNGAEKSTTIVKATDIPNFDSTRANKISLIATGDHFEFYLNNKKLGEADDNNGADVTKYKFALAASTFDDKSSVSASFTDLLIANP